MLHLKGVFLLTATEAHIWVLTKPHLYDIILHIYNLLPLQREALWDATVLILVLKSCMISYTYPGKDYPDISTSSLTIIW